MWFFLRSPGDAWLIKSRLLIQFDLASCISGVTTTGGFFKNTYQKRLRQTGPGTLNEGLVPGRRGQAPAWEHTGDTKARSHLLFRRQATLGIFKGLVEDHGVFTVQVNGTLMMWLQLIPGNIGGRPEVWQPVHSH